jgi:peptidoglycan biosynthesis protein MviN/MurJ (putative lipid II flippase)
VQPRSERRVNGDAGVIFVGMCLSMAVGVGFQSYLASQVGTSLLADAFYIGATFPTVIAIAIIGSAANALVKHSVVESAILDVRMAESVPRRLLPWSLGLSTAAALAGSALRAAAPGALMREIGAFLLVTAPVGTLALIAACGSAAALARGRFVRGTWGPAVNGVGLFAAALLLGVGGQDIWKLGAAIDCGYAAQAVFVVVELKTAGFVGGGGSLKRVQSSRAIRGFMLLMCASLVYKSQPVVERLVGSVVGSGVPAALGYADKVTQGFMQLAVFGFALAALPQLARLVGAGDYEAARQQVTSSLSATFASTIAVIAFALTSVPGLVHVLYQRGAFDASAAHVTRTLIYGALPTVALTALAAPLTAANYAAGRVSFVVRVGLAAFLVGSLATVGLAALLGYRGIVLGTASGCVFAFVAFAVGLRRVIPTWSWGKAIAETAHRLVLVSVVVTSVALASERLVVLSGKSSVVQAGLLGLRFLIVIAASFVVSHRFRHRGRVESRPIVTSS